MAVKTRKVEFLKLVGHLGKSYSVGAVASVERADELVSSGAARYVVLKKATAKKAAEKKQDEK